MHRGYLSDGECVLCTGQDESVQHLLCSLQVFSFIWSCTSVVLGSKDFFVDICHDPMSKTKDKRHMTKVGDTSIGVN